MQINTKNFLGDLSVKDTMFQIGELNSTKCINGDDLEKYILNNENKDLFFLGGVDPKQKYSRAKDNHILSKSYFALDFDIRKDGEITDDEIKKTAFEYLKKFRDVEILKDWRWCVFSGNGFHVYYKLKDIYSCYTSLSKKTKNPRAISVYQNAIKFLHNSLLHLDLVMPDNSCTNIGRIFRLPGSYNNKGYKKLVEILDFQNKLVDIDFNKLSDEFLAEKEVNDFKKITKSMARIDDTNMSSFDEINRIPIENEVLIDFPHWNFNGKNFSDGYNNAACFVNENNVLISGGSKHVPQRIDGFCTYNYRKEVSNMSAHETFLYFEDKYPQIAKLKKNFTKDEEIADDELDKILNEKHDFDLVKIDNPYTWGTNELDKKITPIKRTDYAIFSGETGHGKTTFCIDMAIKNAKLGHKVLFLSLEMTAKNIISRIARDYAGISKAECRTMDIEERRTKEYIAKANELSNMENLNLVGFPAGMYPTTENISKMILKVVPDLVFVDNFDKIFKSQGVEKMEHEINTSAFFLDFTNKNYIPIFVVHHYKKGRERNIESLKGSAKIGHDADIVIAGSRPSMKMTEPTELEKTEFLLFENKTRDFGTADFCTVYFDNGTFSDSSIKKPF